MATVQPPLNDKPLLPDGQWTQAWFRYWQGAANKLNDGALAARVVAIEALDVTILAAAAAEVARALAAEALLAPLASPTFTGTTTVAALTASGTVSGAGFIAWAASPPAIGGTAPAAGAFTTLAASGAISGAGFVAWAASPPAIGGTAAASGKFTSLQATGNFAANGVAPAARPTITGSRGSATVAVLAALLTAMAGTGLITDGTTA